MGVAAFDTAVRLKSTLAPTKSMATECPYSHGRELSPLVKGTVPTLQHAKSFPIIGSMIPQLSGIPNVNPLTNAYEFWIAMSKQYGEWYTFGSLGKCLISLYLISVLLLISYAHSPLFLLI